MVFCTLGEPEPHNFVGAGAVPVFFVCLEPEPDKMFLLSTLLLIVFFCAADDSCGATAPYAHSTVGPGTKAYDNSTTEKDL
jgi:hypothetical protein